MKNLMIFLCLLLVLESCENRSKETEKTEPQHSFKKNEQETQAETFKDTFEFVSYNDDGDYMMLNAQKGKDVYIFINDKNVDRSLLRGDTCIIEWKKDTIFIAGDGEMPEWADWVIQIEKMKDGAVSHFRKMYGKELKYHYFDTKYAQDYLDKIYLYAEYYVANSTNELIISAIQEQAQIEYSIENRIEKNKTYVVLGIGYTFEHRFVVMQWVYLDIDAQKIYEYDLSNDQLNMFES